MIDIIDKRLCCGCSACVQKCPKQCIHLKEDTEGFLYPIVDIDNCIGCNLCEKVCPFLHTDVAIAPRKVLAVKNENEVERLQSSSGGAFIALAQLVLNKGGVVFGAVFDEMWGVKHKYAKTLEEVRPMMGSKYLQSQIGHTYKEAESFLKEGRVVLFVGSPCQLSGLRRFLRKEYSNLLAVDFLCHGVPSPKVWHKYLKEIITRQGDEKNSALSRPISDLNSIQCIKFRSKSTGWKKYSFALTFSETTADGGQNTVLLSHIHRLDPYMKVFLSDIILRPSCYACKCKNGVSHSDLTIADYWGIDELMPDFDDDKGIGLVLINTEKGQEYFDCLLMDVRLSSLQDASRYNGGFKDSLRIHPKRSYFFDHLEYSDDLIGLMEKCTKSSFKERFRQLYYKMRTKL